MSVKYYDPLDDEPKYFEKTDSLASRLNKIIFNFTHGFGYNPKKPVDIQITVSIDDEQSCK